MINMGRAIRSIYTFVLDRHKYMEKDIWFLKDYVERNPNSGVNMIKFLDKHIRFTGTERK